LKAKLITDKSNIAYLSDFNGSSGFMLLAGQNKYLFTDFRYLERATNGTKNGIKVEDIANWKKILSKHKIDTLGIEESNLTLARYKKFKKISGKIKFIDISGEIEAIREIKTDEEIKYTLKSQSINEKVFIEIKKVIQKWYVQKSSTKLYEIDLAWRIKELSNKYGANDISFEPIVAFGAHSALPHHSPGKTALKKGDIVMIDMGMKYKDYCSDMTRMIFTAKPTKRQTEIYNLVLRAQLEAIKHIRAGMTGAKADALSRDIIVKAGYGDRYGHAGGHGVGLDIHETPALSVNFKGKLKTNSIITVEPGIYLPGEFGVRIEDMLLITPRGNKNLTKISKQI